MNKTNWSHSAGIEQNRALEAASTARRKSRSRQSVEDQRRWRLIRPAAAALLEFAYSRLDRDEIGNEKGTREQKRLRLMEIKRQRDRSLRPLNVMWQHTQNEWIPLSSSRRIFALSWANAQRVQIGIRDGIATLVLQYGDMRGPAGRLWGTDWVRLRVVTYRGRVDSVTGVSEVEPEYGRMVLAGAAILARSLPWLRFCELCGRVFFKVKRQITCSRTCSSVLQARNRPDRRRKGDTRGRKRTDYATAIEAQHTAWLEAAYRRTATN
jgi:hypothetical protein